MKTQVHDALSVGKRRNREEITNILQEHRQSGLSLLAFARKHQLCYTTLLRWKRQASGCQAGAVATTGAPRFIPVEIEPGLSNSEYVLSWPEGRSLKIPSGFDPQTLGRLLAVLEATQ